MSCMARARMRLTINDTKEINLRVNKLNFQQCIANTGINHTIKVLKTQH